jgi:dihydrodipicolinate synthase/N-acetylneuraminate lyase
MPVWKLAGKLNKKRESISIILGGFRTNYMYFGIGKAAMDVVGLHGGLVAPPMENLTKEEEQELKTALKEMSVN